MAENLPSVLSTHEANHHQTPVPPPSYIPPPPDSVMMSQPRLYWSQRQERKVLEYTFRTRLARSKRKLARRRTLFGNKAAAASSDGGGAAVEINGCGARPGDGKGWFEFCIEGNKRLMRLLVKKELKKSDVGSLGRIILPKRETEENLPFLHDKEGILIMIRDIYTLQEWVLKFKFWANNKSRMYILENTAPFAKENGLELGDSLLLYGDESKNLYYAIQKAPEPEPEPEPAEPSEATDNDYQNYYQSCQAREEEDAAFLSLLIEQLKHKEQREEEEARSLLGYTPNTHIYGFNNNYYTPQNPYLHHKQI